MYLQFFSTRLGISSSEDTQILLYFCHIIWVSVSHFSEGTLYYILESANALVRVLLCTIFFYHTTNPQYAQCLPACLTFHSGTLPMGPSFLSLTVTHSWPTASGHSHTCQCATTDVTAAPYGLGWFGCLENRSSESGMTFAVCVLCACQAVCFSMAPPSLPALYVPNTML